MYYGRRDTPSVPDKPAPLRSLSSWRFRRTAPSHSCSTIARRKARLAKGFLAFYEVLWADLLQCSPKGLPLYNIIEFGDLIKAERPFQMDLLNLLLFWGRQVTLYSSKRRAPVKREAVLWCALHPLLSTFFCFQICTSKTICPDGELGDGTPLSQAMFFSIRSYSCSGFVNLFYVSANVTAREAVSSTPNNSPLESHHDVC